MHVHSSFSEGRASMLAQLRQAADLGVDVLWWTDHDFRLQALGYRRAVAFEGLDEPVDGSSWTWVERREGSPDEAATTFVDAPAGAEEPGRAMRLAVRSGTDQPATLLREGQAWNSTTTRVLAATRLELDVLLEPAVEEAGDPGEAVVRVLSSYRPATAGRPAGTYALEYRVGGAASGPGTWLEQDGLLGVVAVAAEPGSPVRLDRDLEADVALLWPDLLAADSGLYRLQVGVRARGGAPAAAVVDRLRLDRGRVDGHEPLELQRELMAGYAALFPGVTQHQGSEISLVRHLNAFGGDLTLPDYGPIAKPVKDTSVEAALAMVSRMQAHGSLVAFNHPLEEAGDAATLSALLVSTRALGADLVEVGSKEALDATVAGFDAAARNAVFVTATGTGDDHDGRDWRGASQRWLTSVWAGSTREADLFAALRAGRAWFHDPVTWRGTLDVRVLGAVGMGKVVVHSAKRSRVQAFVPGLPAGTVVTLVRGAVDLRGAEGVPSTLVRQRMTVRNGVAELYADTSQSCYLRVEVRTADGRLAAFANPVWVLKGEPDAGIPGARRA